MIIYYHYQHYRLETMLQLAIMIAIVWSWAVTLVGSHPSTHILLSLLCTIWVPYCCTMGFAIYLYSLYHVQCHLDVRLLQV